MSTSFLSFSDPSEACPICKTSRYADPNLKLFISPCFHKLCEICLDRVFIHGPEPCPTCHLTVRKLQFVVPTFEDLNVEKEVRIRSKLTKLFNRQEKDFPTLEEYNDYLEAIEDLVFSLMEEVDLETIDERLRDYENQFNAKKKSKSGQKEPATTALDEKEKRRKRERDDLMRKIVEATSQKEVDILTRRHHALSLKKTSSSTIFSVKDPPPVAISIDRESVVEEDGGGITFVYPEIPTNLLEKLRNNHKTKEIGGLSAGGWDEVWSYKWQIEGALIGLDVEPLT